MPTFPIGKVDQVHVSGRPSNFAGRVRIILVLFFFDIDTCIVAIKILKPFEQLREWAIMIVVYSLCPFLTVVVGVRATNLIRFVEKTCNIYISK